MEGTPPATTAKGHRRSHHHRTSEAAPIGVFALLKIGQSATVAAAMETVREFLYETANPQGNAHPQEFHFSDDRFRYTLTVEEL